MDRLHFGWLGTINADRFNQDHIMPNIEDTVKTENSGTPKSRSVSIGVSLALGTSFGAMIGVVGFNDR